MQQIETSLEGAFLLSFDPFVDERGSFVRTFCKDSFDKAGLSSNIQQSSLATINQVGTVKGMHFQSQPKQETKIVRCLAGAIYDVIIDLRKDSPTYLQHYGVELSATNHLSIYIPKGFAHGMQTLECDTTVLYQMDEVFAPELASGVRHDDSAFGIEWPMEPVGLSANDASWPLFQ